MISRRTFMALAATLALPRVAQSTGAQMTGFTHGDVQRMAADLAAARYRPRREVPKAWQALSYEQYRSIWPRHDRALWHGSDVPYEIDLFHPGLYFPRAVQVATVENGNVTPVPFDFARFDKTDQVPDLPENDAMGYSGLRLRTAFDETGQKNEFCVFQGASYFRAIGRGEAYGQSARGLALNTGDPAGEEFPDFTRFWVETPAPEQTTITVHALLDSPSVAGAYRFDIEPGESCVMEVQATLFPRTELSHVGLGPLTSMFLYDETNRTRFDDFRPAVHDTDGLLIHNGAGEVLWRHLANPKTLQVSAFLDENPRGFGLMQRARRLGDFADLEAHYHKRPCVWVEPHGDWGPGAVALVEIPADREIYDNIVAYWRPRTRYQPGERVELSYRLTWGEDAPVDPGLARVIGTAMGGRHNGAKDLPGRLVTVDFAAHPAFDAGPEALDIHLSSPHVETTPGVLQRNPETGGMRLAFAFDPAGAGLADLRAQLRRDGQTVTEVWLYRWTA